MAQRSDASSLYLARRTAIRNSLTDRDMEPRLADRWCDAWEAEAEHQGIDPSDFGFWGRGRDWIASQRALRREP
jgi:hypothetical protein